MSWRLAECHLQKCKQQKQFVCLHWILGHYATKRDNHICGCDAYEAMVAKAIES
jgi:hypothetical protein